MMKRINVSLPEEEYELLRALSFKQKKPMSNIVRESLWSVFGPKEKKQAKLILEADDAQELLEIIAENDYLSEDEFLAEMGRKPAKGKK